MRLTEIMTDETRLLGPPAAAPTEITGITSDSRAVRPGYLFAALPGLVTDGRRYIADAIARGAAAVLAPRDTDWPQPPSAIARLDSDNPRRALARMAARFHGAQPRHIAAVTGTNGKTSTARFTQQIWAALGHPAASIGTLGLDSPVLHRAGALTTPDPVSLHRDLATLARAGIDHVALEASSHGLDQYRLDGVHVSAAGFTNLSRDHLDYHGSTAAYFAAKARLFREVLQPGGTAVINADVPEYAALSEIVGERGLRLLDYGKNGRFLTLVCSRPDGGGQRLRINLEGQASTVHLPLIGDFQVQNALCALGLVLAEIPHREDRAEALRALARLSGVPGRLQHVATCAHGAGIYVDYAHTPDGLETVLNTLRPHTEARLIVVFGCGGDRDRGKRPEMAAVAERLADQVVVTDDNPRHENPAHIRADILRGFRDRDAVVEIGDRAAAIKHAIAGLQPGDLLLLAGKGHETGQQVGDTVLPFEDAASARAALAELEGR